ncbi:oligosaccharide flippase family protein [Paenibacillus sp. FSL H8-0537]|uniref:oligosaccharide flippase family protein n=1 Tax=Paenibacillus sp. FSL H8-0537 TaxID=2921399 RepID=UPI003101259C
MGKVKQILQAKDHPFWVIVQQFVTKVLTGVKFLIIARMLGPAEMGLVSIALVSLSIIELLTQLGVMEGIIQRKEDLNNEQKNALWTMMLARGVGISLVLLVTAPYIAQLFGEGRATSLLLLAAGVPLATNAVSIKWYERMRHKDFRSTGILQLITIMLDLSLSVMLVVVLNSPIGVIAGQLIAQLFRCTASFVWFKDKPKLSRDMGSIADIRKYGKWIWANSISTLVLYQLDKVIASRFLGTTVLGLYQTSQKLSQMSISDASYALGQYFFPVLSKLNREDHSQLKVQFMQMLFIIFSFSIVTSGYVLFNAETFIVLLLGNEWMELSPLLGLMLLNASIAGIMNVFVVALRAIGKPRVVTITSYIQLGIYLPLAIAGVFYYQVYGLIYASIIGATTTTVLLFISCFKRMNLWGELVYLRGVFANLLFVIIMFMISITAGNQLTFIMSTFLYLIFAYRLAAKLKVKVKRLSPSFDGAFQSEK